MRIIDHIKNAWKSYIFIGVPRKKLDTHTERIVYSNYIVILVIIVSLLYITKFIIAGQVFSSISTSSLIVIGGLVLFLNHLGKPFLAKLFLNSALNILVIFASLYDDPGDLYPYFAVVVIPFVIFEHKRTLWIYFFVFQTLIFWFLYDYYIQGYNTNGDLYRYFVIYSTFIIIIITVQTFVKLSRKNQAKILEAKKQADEANEHKTQFLSKISHEIKTPLNAALGFSNILLENQSMDNESKDYIRSIKYSNLLLNHMISDILTMSTIEKGKTNLVNMPFEIRNLCTELERNLAFTYPSEKVNFRIIIDNNVPKILFGDEFRLYQILQNICSNALKFTDKGKVSLDIKMLGIKGKETIIELKVKDTGIGISPEDLKLIFEAFVQLDHQLNKPGFGLGLTITKNLVELLDGKINVQSQLGQGTEFLIEIPFDMKPLVRNTERQYRKIPVFNNLSVLVIDDNELNGQLFEHLLTMTGISPVICDHVIKAKALLEENPIKLIIINVNSDEFHVHAFIKELKNSDQFHQLPIIAICNEKKIDEHASILSENSIPILETPINKEHLFELLTQNFQSVSKV